MDYPDIWIAVVAVGWLLCVASLAVYACYVGWIGPGPLARLGKKGLYLLLRISRTSALLFISVAVIAFLYFETDVFPRKIPDLDVQLTHEQYQAYLKQRHESIDRKYRQASAGRKEILEKEKSEIDTRLADTAYSHNRYVEWLSYQMNQLARLQNRVPSRVLRRALETASTGDMLEIDIALEQLENMPEIKAGDSARLAFMRGSLARWSLNYSHSYEHYARAARISGDNPRFHKEAGYMAYRIGKPKASLEHYESALAGHLAKHGENHPEVAADYNGIGRAWRALDDDHKALHYFQRALRIDQHHYPEDHPVIVERMIALGLALESLKEYARAVEHYEKALAVDLNKHGKSSFEVMNDYEHLGRAWKKSGDYRRSATYYEKALAICLRLYGEDHDYTADYRDTLGGLWGELREYEVSLAHYEQALSFYRKHEGENHPRVLRIRSNVQAIREWLKSRKS